MEPLPAGRLPALNTFALASEVPDLRLVRQPEALRDHLATLSAGERGAVEIAGELSNTVLGARLGAPLILFRDGPLPELDGGRLVRVAGSTGFDALVAHLCHAGIAGIELLSGIPGTVGAAIVQNIAAYGQAVADRFVSARAFDLESATIVTLDRAALGFAYRRSALKLPGSYTPRRVILDVLLAFPEDAPAPLAYGDLAARHAERGRDDHPLARRATVLEVRDRKGMVARGPHWVPSAGSFFLNPAVPADTARRIAAEVRGAAFADGFFSWYRPDAASTRVPAALLMRAAGFMNGDRWGTVGLSPHHILALTAYPGATGDDVAALGRLVQSRIHDRFAITLEPEVRFLGAAAEEEPPAFLARCPFTPGRGEPDWAAGLAAGT
jgi:UDP-N-acetylmuramate dehydrogenase